MAAGNRSLLVILDSRRPGERSQADLAVFAALDHFGVAYEALECADYMARPPGHLAPRAAYVVAHDGAGAGLKPDDAAQIARAVEDGAGLIVLDREVQAWPDALRKLLPSGITATRAAALQFVAPERFITRGHPQGEEVELDRELDAIAFPADDRFTALSATPAGECIIARGTAGAGRVVVFGTGCELYAPGVFGHVRGLDGLLWRSLVWAAAKPFPMRCIPPYLTARMDDCNGAHSAFQWVDALNRRGIKPNLGLFIDELGPTDWAAAKRLFDAGLADFSMHAFRDDFYKAQPNYKPHAVLADKPDLSSGGEHTAFEGLSLDHNTGRDLDDATIARNFERMDAAFARAGIRHSRVINAHFGEIGWRAARPFLDRGCDLPCNNSVLGQLYGDQPPWRPKPYGARGPNGRHGLTIDRLPQFPGLTLIAFSSSHVGKTHMVFDVLSGHTPFLGESSAPKMREAADRGISNATLGLDALAWGVIMTHEERIDSISLADWTRCVDWIVAGLDGLDYEPAGREEVSIVVKRLFDSALVHAHLTDDGLRCELCGQTDGPSPLTIWDNEGETCVRRVVDAPELNGVAVVRA